MWEFVVPLTLVTLTPHSLLPPSVYGLCTQITVAFLSSYLGKFIDKYHRLKVVGSGIAAQVMFIAVASVIMSLLLEIPDGQIDADIFATRYSSALFVSLLLFAAIGLLGTTTIDLAVERDWIPELFMEEDLLIMNSRMRGIDLGMDIVGPLTVSYLMSASQVTPKIGFLTIAAINFLSFFPQFLLLFIVYRKHSFALEKKLFSPPFSSSSSPFASVDEDWNPIIVLKESSLLFIKQPVALVVVAWSFLWMTLLSPHDIVLTSYLKGQGVSDWELSIFRGISAIVGLCGTLSFPYLSQRYGLKTVSQLCIAEEGVVLIMAGVAFTLIHLNIANEVMMHLFMVFLIMSRFGLYAFGIGELTLLQQGIPESIRGRVNSFETVLCNLATFIVYSGSAIISNPGDFIWLAWASVISVNCGVLIFAYWNYHWEIKEEEHEHHPHADGEGDGGGKGSDGAEFDHLSCHNKQQKTIIEHQQANELTSPFRHRHVFLVRRKPQKTKQNSTS